jgi:hypothetical protein
VSFIHSTTTSSCVLGRWNRARRVGVSTVALAAAALLSPNLLLAQPSYNGVQINTDGVGLNIPDDAANEPSWALSPIDPNVMVVGWRQFDTITSSVRFAGFAYSDDGGATWTNGGVLEPPPPDPTTQQSDPVMAVDAAGSFFYNSLCFGGPNGYSEVVYRSDDGGANWGIPTYVSPLGRGGDKNWYEIDRVPGNAGNHYCIWGNSSIYFTRSLDEGVTWSDTITLSRRRDKGNCLLSYIGIGAEGEVYTGWWNYSNDYVAIRKSVNAKDPLATPTFTDEIELDFGAWAWELPVNPAGGASPVWVEVDTTPGPRNGWVYVVSSAVKDGDPCDVYFARSTDGGLTFTDPVRINDDPVGNDHLQWMAAMSVSPTGRIDVTWFDTRDDAGKTWSRLYYTYSYDGGDTWAASRPLSDSFDPLVGWPQQQKIGDYFQSKSDDNSAMIVYPATFNGEQDLYFVRAFPCELEVSPLTAGQSATFTVTGARPNAPVGLAYSRVGAGSTYVASILTTLGIKSPIPFGPVKTTNSNGEAVWNLFVPSNAGGQDVWIQAAQYQNASQVVATTISN